MRAQAITRLELLNSEECGAVRLTVFELRERWLRRNPEFPFFTLGAASYIDAQADREDYQAKARAFNPLLSRHFGGLYEKLAARLASHLGAPVTYAPELALPGYHVYLAHPIFEKPIASIHCDTQYRLVDWSWAGPTDFAHPISFTLAVALPQSGGGMHIWELHYDQLLGLEPQVRGQRIRDSERHYCAYQLGQLVLHSGHVLHQAAPAKRVLEGDARITLQGHALQCDGKWILYW
jgi:hypothetical protein